MKVAVVIPNWNGIDLIRECLEGLRAQTQKHQVIVVDNGSVDGSDAVIRDEFPEVMLLAFPNNAGFAGGVNRGIRPALEQGYEAVALLNNDAVADKHWLERLVKAMEEDDKVGAVAAKIATQDGTHLDSTGDFYSVWGWPFPRGRGEEDQGQYDGQKSRQIFAASGGASLYRSKMLKEVGIFDERFFAYFEDTDIGFRMQLAGWTVLYEPGATVRHYIGATSSRMDAKGNAKAAPAPGHDRPSPFARYHSVKNFAYLYTKNMPGRLYLRYLPRWWAAWAMMLVSDAKRGMLKGNLKANWTALMNLPGVLWDRRRIQRGRKVSIEDIDRKLYKQLPPMQRLRFRRLGLAGPGVWRETGGKRIVIDGRLLYWTGVGRYTNALLTNLPEYDSENQYVVLMRRADWGKWEPEAPNFKKVEANINPYTFGEQLRLWWLLVRLRPDLVHFVAPNSPGWYRGRKVVTVHDLTLVDFDTSRGNGLARRLRGLKRWPFRFLVRRVARQATLVLTATEFVERQLARRFDVDRKLVRVVPLGFDEPARVSPVRPAAVGEDDEFLFMVGNFYPYKNAGSTVEALKLLSAKFPDLKLVAAGQPDWHRDQLEAKVRALGLTGRVVLPGRVSDGEKAWLYQHARLYVYPSRSEGFGLQGLEAMSEGLPVVAAKASCLPEVYGNAAVYFDPSDPKAQAEKISDLLKGGELRDRLVKAGHDRVKLYSWKRMAKRTVEVYEEALALKR